MQAQELRLAEAAEALTAVTTAHHAESKRAHELHNALAAESRAVLNELTSLDPTGEAESQPAGELKQRYDALQAEVHALKQKGIALIADTAHNDRLQARR